ncbi:MAG: hypothetical protein ACJ0RC_00915 [Alphaproteobacteria bacterium]
MKKFFQLDRKKLIRVFNVYKKYISTYDQMTSIGEIYFTRNYSKKIDENFQMNLIIALEIF